MDKKLNGLIIFLLGILIGGIIIKFGPGDLIKEINNYTISMEDNPLDYYQNKYKRFELVDNILKEGYYNYENIDMKHITQEALKSYVDGIGDPYTVYMDAKQNSGFIGSLEGEEEFEGIGAVVTKKDYYVQIEEVLKGSPAFKAGIKPLDRIIKIDSGYVEKETIDDAVARMKGPAGTKVHITIERYNNKNDLGLTGNNGKKIIELDLTREKINVPSVTSKIFEVKTNNDSVAKTKKIGYIEMFIIGEETEKIFKKEIKDLKAAGVESIMLDLRGNGGGLMPIAVEIVSHFVSKGKLVVSAKYKGYEDENYYSKGYGDFEGMPIIVLIDGMTASAGEIIAMALQEQAGAKLVGIISFGKGTIQTMQEFNDGDSLKYTIGKWFSPSEKNINHIGVSPDVTIEFDAETYINNNYDNQLEEAKNMLK